MGCCATSPDDYLNSQVRRELDAAKETHKRRHKLLFLGSGGSGKSTFFKQLRCIHGRGFSDKDRRVYKEHISAQIVEQINRSVECIPYHNERLPEDCEPLRLTPEGEISAKYLESIGQEVLVNEEVAAHIETLWREDAIRQIYKNRAIYHIDDSSAYFFDHILRIGELASYTPTNEDILYVRYRTTGVIEWSFSITGESGKVQEFDIFDVGGQQSERRKWIHCFEKVTAVIFVASLSCYDELMFEDDTINCMVDSLELFREICNLQWFVDTPIILFLNKNDLFLEKIHIIPLSVCFDKFEAEPPRGGGLEDSVSGGTATGNEHESVRLLLEEQRNQYMQKARQYIQEQFMEYAHGDSRGTEEERQIYVHVTVATDDDNVRKVFRDIQQIVVSHGLRINNLL